MPTNKFVRVIIIFNPASTNTNRLKRRINELEKIFSKDVITIIETSKEGREANQKLIRANKKLLGSKTLLCIAAGDGTVNLVIETLLTDSALSDTMRATPVLPLWGGNANDLAHMLNGYTSFNTIATILRKGKVIKVNPLHITLQYENEKEIKIAACYASFGATAYAASRINAPSHRKQKLTKLLKARVLGELHTVTRAFIHVPRFTIHENGTAKRMYEYAMINGSRIAKFERMPIRLTDNAFYVIRISKKHPVVALYVLQILRKRRFGRITSTKRTFTVTEPTWFQTDGEVIKIKTGTVVSIELSKQPFYALSKRLRRA